MTVLFDRLAYMDHLKRAGLSEEHARAYAEALEEALHSAAARTDHDVMSALLRNVSAAADRISKLDEQEMRRKAFWKATNNFGPMLFFGAALGVMLAVLLK